MDSEELKKFEILHPFHALPREILVHIFLYFTGDYIFSLQGMYVLKQSFNFTKYIIIQLQGMAYTYSLFGH